MGKLIRQLEINATIKRHIDNLLLQKKDNKFIFRYIKDICSILNKEYDRLYILKTINNIKKRVAGKR